MSDADALVVFGITGDLAKKMTLRSLYRLEQRRLLKHPVVGVAVNDWRVEHLREHAHESIVATGETIDEDVFKRFAEDWVGFLKVYSSWGIDIQVDLTSVDPGQGVPTGGGGFSPFGPGGGFPGAGGPGGRPAQPGLLP